MKEKTARERVGVALQEHRMAEALIAALSRATPRENRFDAIMRLLASHIGRLQEQDEVYIIPLAAKLPRAKQESLLREMEEIRERLQKEKAST